MFFLSCEAFSAPLPVCEYRATHSRTRTTLAASNAQIRHSHIAYGSVEITYRLLAPFRLEEGVLLLCGRILAHHFQPVNGLGTLDQTMRIAYGHGVSASRLGKFQVYSRCEAYGRVPSASHFLTTAYKV